MSNNYIMSNQTREGQPQYYVNSYPHPTAPPAIIEENVVQSTINPNYPAYNPNNQSVPTITLTLEEYQRLQQLQYQRAPRYNGPRRQRVIMVDEVDYLHREKAQKSGFWAGVATLFCCLFCCCPMG